MPMICYQERKFSQRLLDLIDRCNGVIEEYQRDGYDLTVRQLYYQLVSRDVIENTPRSYQNICSLLSNARRAGLIDWDAIVDRTRNLQSRTHWDEPAEILSAIGRQFHVDLWEGQDNYVEVWFEKDALMGVFERAANPLDVPFFSCRGFASDSEVWAASQRFNDQEAEGKQCVLLHFSDHDPSGIEMSADIETRFALFEASHVEIRRIALTMQQVRQYAPPPNPAKQLDPRFKSYAQRFGNSSWELDALEPRVLAALVDQEIRPLLDENLWNERLALRAEGRGLLSVAAQKWTDVEKLLRQKHKKLVASQINIARSKDDLDAIVEGDT